LAHGFPLFVSTLGPVTTEMNTGMEDAQMAMELESYSEAENML
jgi:hypothetical protein